MTALSPAFYQVVSRWFRALGQGASPQRLLVASWTVPAEASLACLDCCRGGCGPDAAAGPTEAAGIAGQGLRSCRAPTFHIALLLIRLISPYKLVNLYVRYYHKAYKRSLEHLEPFRSGWKTPKQPMRSLEPLGAALSLRVHGSGCSGLLEGGGVSRLAHFTMVQAP